MNSGAFLPRGPRSVTGYHTAYLEPAISCILTDTLAFLMRHNINISKIRNLQLPDKREIEADW